MLKNSLKIVKFSTKIDRVTKITQEQDSILGVLYSNHKRHNPVVPLIRLLKDNDVKIQGVSRKSAYDYINEFVKKVLPKVETFVENRLLEKFKLNLTQKEKVLVDDVYRQRKIQAKPLEEIIVEQPVAETDHKPFISMQRILEVYNSYDGKGVSYHTAHDLGNNWLS